MTAISFYLLLMLFVLLILFLNDLCRLYGVNWDWYAFDLNNAIDLCMYYDLETFMRINMSVGRTVGLVGISRILNMEHLKRKWHQTYFIIQFQQTPIKIILNITHKKWFGQYL